MAGKEDLVFDIIVRDRNGTVVMEKLGQSAEDAGKHIESIGGKAEKGARKFKDVVSGILAADAIKAIGAKAAEALRIGFEASMEREVAFDRLGAQLGLDPTTAKDLGRVAGKLYTEAFGESMADNAEAVRTVMRAGVLFEDATIEDVEDMTRRAMTFADVMGKDIVLSARAAGQMVRTGLVMNGVQAFDLLTTMIQQTGDHADDLLDTMVEYSTQFREVGLDGRKALGMITQALKAGARDADTVADAIKEFAIRSKDGSKTSADAFKSIGLNAKTMFRVFAEGGPAADKAMSDVIQRIKSMKNPVEQDAVAVALFGTKAEDLQDALYAIDPTTAIDELGETKGAVDELASAYDNSATKIESMKRRTEQALADLADKLVAFFTEDIEGSEKLKRFFADIESDMRAIADEHIPHLKKEWQSLLKDIGANSDDLRVIAQAAALVAINSAGAFMVLSRGAVAASSIIVGTLRTMVDLILADIEMVAVGASKAFGWVPGLGGKLKSAAKEFQDFRRRANEALGGISNRTVHVDVSLRGIKNLEEQVAVRLGRREKGGPVRRGEAYIVGEKRAEIFVPDQDGVILPEVPHRGNPMSLGGVGGSTQVAFSFPRGASTLEQLLVQFLHQCVTTGKLQLAVQSGQQRLPVMVG